MDIISRERTLQEGYAQMPKNESYMMRAIKIYNINYHNFGKIYIFPECFIFLRLHFVRL